MRPLLFILFTFIITTLHSQTVLRFQEMEQHGIVMAKLDSAFPNAIPGTKAGVFGGKQLEKFNKAWLKFYTDLMKYLNKNGFRWDTTTYCFNKVYFSADGHVQYWLYNFRKADSIPEERQMRFQALLVDYCKTHTIHIKAKTPFSQCASVDFIDLACNVIPCAVEVCGSSTGVKNITEPAEMVIDPHVSLPEPSEFLCASRVFFRS